MFTHPGYNPETDPQEGARRWANAAIRTGTVLEIDRAAGRVRVQTGELQTDWLPWHTGRAGGTQGRKWWAPVVGEQGLLLAPGGDLRRAVLLPGMYSDAMPQPQGLPEGADRTDWDDENSMQWAEGAMAVTCTESITLTVGDTTLTIDPSSITLQAGGATLVLDSSGATITPEATIGGIAFTPHIHGGVLPGPLFTTQPVGGGAP